LGVELAGVVSGGNGAKKLAEHRLSKKTEIDRICHGLKTSEDTLP
jgi:hypothetical protein